ncbi:MAG: hypothetical protein U0822_27130 [Anaerolineae bacterium]
MTDPNDEMCFLPLITGGLLLLRWVDYDADQDTFRFTEKMDDLAQAQEADSIGQLAFQGLATLQTVKLVRDTPPYTRLVRVTLRPDNTTRYALVSDSKKS